MKYYRDSWKDRAVFGRHQPLWRRWRWVAALIVIAVFLLVAAEAFFRVVEWGAVGVGGLAWRAEVTWLRPFGGLFNFFQSRQALITENEDLSRQLREKASLVLENDWLRQENRIWRELFGRVSYDDLPLVAKVLTPSTFSADTLLLDLGYDRGPHAPLRGDLVTSGAVLIGQIEAVTSQTAKVKSFSWPGEILPVTIGGSGLVVEAVGLGGGSYEVIWPKGLPVREGEAVSATVFGENWILGQVAAIEENPSDPDPKLIVKNPVNLRQLDRVEIYAF